MRYDRFFTKLFCSPLLLEPGARAGYERLLLSLMANARAEIVPAARKPGADAKKYAEQILEVQGPTAFIHIDGAIDKHLSALDRLCFDATDLNDVDGALARVGADKTIANVLLCINSPGGTISGLPETAGRIAALAERKNVFALIDGMGCSAAYWLASQADQVFATRSSLVGSIGVYLALLDETRWLEKEGLKIETIQDGKLKAAGASWKALTDPERAHFQSMVAQMGKLFRGEVTAKRPKLQQEHMEGQSFFGDEALKVGLLDAIVPDRAAVLAQF
jgi:protease-4